MRCNCLKCVHNIDGFCECSSYIEIDKNGECDSMCILIDRDDDKTAIERGKKSICDSCSHQNVCKRIENQPCTKCIHYQDVADVAKVRHGRWIDGDPYCPICRKDKFRGLDADVWSDWKPDYCPNCGCRMDLKV